MQLFTKQLEEDSFTLRDLKNLITFIEDSHFGISDQTEIESIRLKFTNNMPMIDYNDYDDSITITD